MQSDRQPKVVPVVRVARMFRGFCPCCGRYNHEDEATMYDAISSKTAAKGKCVRCEAEVELSL